MLVAIAAPSMTRYGSRRMSNRSLNDPGSPSAWRHERCLRGRMRPTAPLALASSLAALFLASTSRAEDGPRFRGGVFLQGAAYVVPGH